jgi:hypothetical protein
MMTTATPPRVLKIWRDTIKVDLCAKKRCRKRIWWAQVAKSLRFVCFNVAPDPIVTETEVDTGRELLTVDASTVHFATCAGNRQARRTR